MPHFTSVLLWVGSVLVLCTRDQYGSGLNENRSKMDLLPCVRSLNLTQERALRLVCKGSETECENLMKRPLTTHQHNLQLLMSEIYKTKHSLNPTFMRDVFAERNNQHDLRNENHLRLPVAKTTTYGLETVEYRGYLL